MKWWSRYRSLNALPQACIVLLCFISHVLVVQASITYVSQSGETNTTGLLPALQSTTGTIVLTSNYTTGDEFDGLIGNPLPINRNITITGLPGQLPVLDLQARPGLLDLCNTCTFTFDGIAIANESIRGSGTIVSFLRGKGASRVQHLNGYGLRLVCPQTNSTLQVINSTIRSTLFPPAGGLQLAHAINVSYQGKLYKDQVHVDDISSDVPLQLLTGGYYVGGYGIHRKNATRICQYSVSDECVARLSPDECAAEIVANLTRADGAEAGAGHRVNPVAIAVPIALGGAALLAVLGGMLVMKRRNAQQLKRASSYGLGLGDVGNTDHGPPGHGMGAHSESVGGSAGLHTALLVSPSHQETSQDLGLPALPAGGGSGIWELSWRHTAPSMERAADDAAIELGPLLGAGSFARVFKAKWAGLDVAVKVIQHDTSTAAVVANEVQLMMHLNHPNIVRAYHCVTKQHKPPSQMQDTRQHSPPLSSAGARHSSGPSSRRSTVVAMSAVRSPKRLAQGLMGTGSGTAAPETLASGVADIPLEATNYSNPQWQQQSWGPSSDKRLLEAPTVTAAGAAVADALPGLVRQQGQGHLSTGSAPVWRPGLQEDSDLLQQQQQEDQRNQRLPLATPTGWNLGRGSLAGPASPHGQQQPEQRRLSVLLPVAVLADAPETPVAATAQHQTVSWPSSALTSCGHDLAGIRSLAAGSAVGPRTASGTGSVPPEVSDTLPGARCEPDNTALARCHVTGTLTETASTLATTIMSVPPGQHDHTMVCSSDSSEDGPRSLAPACGPYRGRISRTPSELGQQQHINHHRPGRSVTSPYLGMYLGVPTLAVALQQADGAVLRAQLEAQEVRLHGNRAAAAAGNTAEGSAVHYGQPLGTTRALYSSPGSTGSSNDSTAAARSEEADYQAGLPGTARARYAPEAEGTAQQGGLPGTAKALNAPPESVQVSGVAASSSTILTSKAVSDSDSTRSGKAPPGPVSSLRPGPDTGTTAVAGAAAALASGQAASHPGSRTVAVAVKSEQGPVAEARSEYHSMGSGRATMLPGTDHRVQPQLQLPQQHGAGDVAVHGYFNIAPRARRSSAPAQPTAWMQQQQPPPTDAQGTSLMVPDRSAAGSIAAAVAVRGDDGSVFRPCLQERAAYLGSDATDRESHRSPGTTNTPETAISSNSSAWPIMDSVPAGSATDMHDRTAGADIGSMCETWLVTELCDRGTVSRTAADWRPAGSEKDMLKLLWLLQDVARGLTLLHSKSIVHADLNGHNVLVSSSSTAPHGLVAKIADLGLSRIIKQHATHRTTRTIGTLSHQPPELLQDGHTSPAVDIYSFGVMMWELYTGQAAFGNMRYGQIYNQVVLLGARPPVPPDMPDDYQLLMARCWAAASDQRPSVDMLLDCLGLMIHDREHPNSFGMDSSHEGPASPVVGS